MDSSYKKIFKASSIAVIGQIILIANQLILVPVYLKSWGPHLYGEWLILSAVPSIMAMAGDLGFGTAAANEMNLQVVKGNKSAALVTFQNAWIVISAYSILFLIAILFAVFNYSITKTFHLNYIPERHSKLVLLFLLMNILTTQQNGLLLAGFRSEGNYILGMMIGNISKVAELVLVLLFITLIKIEPYYVAIIFFSVSSTTYVFYRFLLSKKSPWIKYSIKTFSKSEIKKQTPIALSFLSFPITQALSVQGTITIVGYMYGPTSVVLLNTIRTFMNVLKQAVATINTSVWPELTTAYSHNDIRKVKKIFYTSIKISIVLIVVYNILMFLIGKQLYVYWTKNQINVSDLFFYSFALITSVSALWNVFGIIQGATNKTKKFAMYNIASSIILILLLLTLKKTMGVDSLLVSFLVSELFMLVFIIRNSQSILKASQSPLS